jgi:hypothetical protein
MTDRASLDENGATIVEQAVGGAGEGVEAKRGNGQTCVSNEECKRGLFCIGAHGGDLGHPPVAGICEPVLTE